jgi:hypothetical protein
VVSFSETAFELAVRPDRSLILPFRFDSSQNRPQVQQSGNQRNGALLLQRFNCAAIDSLLLPVSTSDRNDSL